MSRASAILQKLCEEFRAEVKTRSGFVLQKTGSRGRMKPVPGDRHWVEFEHPDGGMYTTQETTYRGEAESWAEAAKAGHWPSSGKPSKIT